MRVLLLDGHNLFHRSRYGFDAGVNRVTFNFFNSFKSLLYKFKPDIVYLVLEGEPVKNKQLLPQYKANREESPADFKFQCRQICALMQLTPCIQVHHPNFECDDVLHTLAVVKHANDDVFIVSTDSDFIQVLRQHRNVQLWNPVKKIFVEKPDYDYVTWKALRGDKTDNVPAVCRVTDERALEIVNNPEQLLSLRKDPTFEAKFQRNLELIRLEQVNLEECVWVHGTADFEMLRNSLRDFKFDVYTRDKPWSKFVSYMQRK